MNCSQEIQQSIVKILSEGKQCDITDPKTLVSNLIFLYHTMKASENLLVVAMQNTPEDTPLYEYFVRHLREEKSHELWLVEDLQSIGIDVSTTIVPREAVEMVGSIYYLIYHLDSSALLGYMFLMECFPMNLSIVAYLETLYGNQLLRTARYHAEHDIDHGADIKDLIDRLPTDKQAIVKQTAFQSAIYFRSAITRLL